MVISAPRQRERQVRLLLAGPAERPEAGEVRLGACSVADHQEQLTLVFERAEMVGVGRERGEVERRRLLERARLAAGKPYEVQRVRVARVLSDVGRQKRERAIEVAAVDGDALPAA